MSQRGILPYVPKSSSNSRVRQSKADFPTKIEPLPPVSPETPPSTTGETSETGEISSTFGETGMTREGEVISILMNTGVSLFLFVLQYNVYVYYHENKFNNF